jgi:subtilisin family serine protease
MLSCIPPPPFFDYSWEVSDWSECNSNDCGEGIESRDVWCANAEGSVVNDKLCSHLTKPSSTNLCVLPDCPIGQFCEFDSSLNKNVCVGYEGCTDTDGGLNYFERGTTTNASGVYVDTCVYSEYLIEYYCSADNVLEKEIHCANFDGRCFDGACVSHEEYCDLVSPIELSINNVESSGVLNIFDTNNGVSQVSLNSRVVSGALSSEGIILEAAGEIKYNSFNSVVPFNVGASSNDRYIVVYDMPALAEHFVDYKEELELLGDSLGSFARNNLRNEYNSKKDMILSEIQKNSVDVKKVVGDEKVLETYSGVISGVLVEASALEVARLRNLPNVKAVYPDEEVFALLMDSIPQIKANLVHEIIGSDGNLLTGEGITIAVLDTGIDHTHPDLGGCLGINCKVIESIDFTNTVSSGLGIDDHGHGTHVAATAAGQGVLTGVAPSASLISYKVLAANGGGYTSGIISAIERAMDPNQDGSFDDHVDIISLSLGNSDGSSTNPMSLAINNAVDIGVVAVIAAGNAGRFNTIGSPGTARNAITVAAVDKENALAGFSSKGPTADYYRKPDVSAPGVGICAAQWNVWLNQFHCVDDEHIAISGTSMATPHVSGVVALLLQDKPYLSPEEVKSIIMQSSNQFNKDSNDFYVVEYGAGVVDALNVINLSVVVTPSHFEFENKNQEYVSHNIVISNYGVESKKLFFKNVSAKNFGEEEYLNINLVSVESSCLAQGESEELILNFEFDSFELDESKGLSIGAVLVEEYDCSQSINEYLGSREILFSNRNMYDLNISINFKDPDFLDYGRVYVFDKEEKKVLSNYLFSSNNFTISVSQNENLLVGYTSCNWYFDEFSLDCFMGLFDVDETLFVYVDEVDSTFLSYELPALLQDTIAYRKTYSVYKNDVGLFWTSFIPTLCPQYHQDFVTFNVVGVYDELVAEQMRGPPSRYDFNSAELYLLYADDYAGDNLIFNSNFNEYDFSYKKDIIPHDLGAMIGGYGPILPGQLGASFWTDSGDVIAGQDLFEKTIYVSDAYSGIFTGTTINLWPGPKTKYQQTYLSYSNIEDLQFYNGVSFEPYFAINYDWSGLQIIEIQLDSGSISFYDVGDFDKVKFLLNYEDNNAFDYFIEGPSQNYSGTTNQPILLNCNGYSVPAISCEQGSYKLTQYFDDFDDRLSTANGEFCWTGMEWLEGLCS